jgi:hypothetical protein
MGTLVKLGCVFLFHKNIAPTEFGWLLLSSRNDFFSTKNEVLIGTDFMSFLPLNISGKEAFGDF